MKKKLIEVALPLEAINIASAREKSIRHGHPSTLHLWWARRPLATCRAVLFASLVDDPSSHPAQFPTRESQDAERQRLFRIIERMVPWEAINDKVVLAEAWAEILKSTGGRPPAVYDPFCGGGSIPLEAQRLGLEAHASDLNPVAVLITKALIEIPPKFANQAPVNSEARRKGLSGGAYPRAMGLAEDVRYYGTWMKNKAQERIGHLYPPVKLPDGGEATVVAWLWARTVKCPNPACGAEMPLVRSFALSTKKGRQAWVEPVVDQAARTVRFAVQMGQGKVPAATKTARGANFRCLVCNQTASDTHVKAEAMSGRLGRRLLAIVAEGERGRIYIEPSKEQERVADLAEPEWRPEEQLPYDPRAVWCTLYGMKTFGDLFTPRQLVALTTFADLVGEARFAAIADGASEEYADAIATYLAFALSKMADRGSSICTWFTERDSTRNTFARQAIPMTWDFAELNVLLQGTGSFEGAIQWTAESLQGVPAKGVGVVTQLDATLEDERQVVFSSDPPYYDNNWICDSLRFLLRLVAPFSPWNLLTTDEHFVGAESTRACGHTLSL